MSSVLGSDLRSSRLGFAGLVAASMLWIAAPALGGAYLSQEEALELAFPDAERIEARNFVLTRAQKERIQQLAQAPLESQLLTVHVGWQNGAVQGYALIDVHTVRTLPEALMTVLSPEGRVRSVRVLAFYEPEEFLPSDRFRRQYENGVLDADLQLGQGIQAVAGATLSARATTRSVRSALAIHTVLLSGDSPTPRAAEQTEPAIEGADAGSGASE